MKLDLTHYWYQSTPHPLSLSLLPFSWLFGMGVAFRRFLYRIGLYEIKRFAVPVIVVGNITVGGTGKTPFVIWLANLLQEQGYRPGIVSRGVGGKKHKIAHPVLASDSPADVGDEAKLFLQRVNCPIVIGADRTLAVYDLLARSNCNIILCDDGLQHYRLNRDIEIAIVDGMRGFGNGYLLPAGPLREKRGRLTSVDFIVMHGDHEAYENKMSLEPTQILSLKNRQAINFAHFSQQKIHAVCGIGNPQRFFSLLEQAHFEIIPHVFKDHHLFTPKDFQFNDNLPIIMTEKDAVKCLSFAHDDWWYVQVAAKIEKKFRDQLLARIKSVSQKRM